MKKPEIEIRIITPLEAKKMLEESNFHNRKYSNATVKRYAADMRNGDWDTQAFSPIVMKDKDVLDGQHRLMAVIRADRAVAFFVAHVHGKSSLYDRGRLRSTKDVLEMDGIDISRKSISLIKWLLRRCFGLQQPTDMQVKKYYKAHDEELNAAITISKTNGGRKANEICRLSQKTVLAASCYQMLICGAERIELREFFNILQKGIPEESWQTAPLMARNYILGHQNKDRNDDYVIDAIVQTAFLDFSKRKKRMRSYREDVEPPYREKFISMEKDEIEKIKGEAREETK